MTTTAVPPRAPAFQEWFEARKAAHEHRVRPLALDRLDGWRFHEDTGNLVHRSGRFFTVEGLRTYVGEEGRACWSQPVIVQPETGILGILVKRFGTVPYCLMQAKMEPGNINTLQLSPTVQATRSNYTRVHQGNRVPYLEHFTAPRRGRVLLDVLQSEQGAWFLGKRNRNMIVEVEPDEDVPVLDDFRWIGLAELRSLLHTDNLVNMDSRTVLSGMPPTPPTAGTAGTDGFFRPAPDGRARHDTAYLRSWFTEARTANPLVQRRVPLADLADWEYRDGRLAHRQGGPFAVIGVDVEAGGREVPHWTQPMVAPTGRGLAAFLVRRLDGVPHVLVKAHTEPGTFDAVEMGPTVQCFPGGDDRDDAAERPPYLDLIRTAPPSAVRFDAVHSEEGGRFHHAETRYVIVEAGPDAERDVPDTHVWMTMEQLTGFVRCGGHVNVEARSLLACLHTLG
ncbi:NDP-hexose 2,3-dehydratase family protein [Streptomyces lydicus]|uniref:NDP-hexose 2,3-dehydratase family protein n=1 Tax=Streptomyces lydicus TaxID=47763 RepID=UPI00286FDB3C|nr:NDP-hexose 2,3-dehydratase family protein [Streptomyces lydicus]